ncbi:MAG: hypothetical protein HZA50_02175 [Planctomycetes bacterium]|nr:hypothetical protein [Planctomycetota bacterium]
MLSIKQNVMAMEVARNLGLAYDSLGKSVDRLSSGLRIRSAADDAAGLAVRELMRADIGALGQGKRNAMDGVSLLQTAEAGLGQIDTLLIRMRELSEQGSTGTYTKQQKQTIQAEFESLSEEINRIAEQMDFNGINLLNNSNTTRISIGNGPNNRGQYIEVISQDMSAASLRIGGLKSRVENKDDASVAAQDTAFVDFGTAGQTISNTNGTSWVGEGLKFTFSGGTYIGFGPTVGTTQLVTVTSMSITLDNSTAVGTITTSATNIAYHIGTGNKSLAQVVSAINSAAVEYAAATSQTQFENWAPAEAYFNASTNRYYLDVNQSVNGTWDIEGNFSGAKEVIQGTSSSGIASSTSTYVTFGSAGAINITFGSGSATYISHSTTLGQTTATVTYGSFALSIQGSVGAGITVSTANRTVELGLGLAAAGAMSLDNLIGNINSAAQQFAGNVTAEYTMGTRWVAASAFQNSSGQYVLDVRAAYDGNIALTAGTTGENVGLAAGTATSVFKFNASNDGLGGGTAGVDVRFAYSVSNATPTNGSAMAVGDWWETHGEGVTIDLVNGPCPAVTALDTAINIKDSYRAYLGYTMNRLTSVADTLDVQMLQLQGAESRISDVDVATETANMTRNTVLAQAGVAMLSMANGLPQMALSLLGG